MPLLNDVRARRAPAESNGPVHGGPRSGGAWQAPLHMRPAAHPAKSPGDVTFVSGIGADGLAP